MSFETTLAGQKFLSIGLAVSLAFFLALSLMPGHAHAAVVTLVSATTTSNNASTTLAKVGNTITFGLTLSGTPSATTTPMINLLNMGSTSFIGSGTYWQYSTTSVSAWGNGALTFYEAWGGSAGESTTTISQAGLTGANVVFDKSAPTISSITSSASCNAGICSPGNTATFTLTPGSTEYGGSVVGSYENHPLTWSTSDAGAHYTATYSVTKGDPSSGTPVQISGVILTDAAGNASSAGAGSDVSFSVSASNHNPVVMVSSGSSGGGSSSSSSHSSSSSSNSSSSNTTSTTQTSTPTTNTTSTSSTVTGSTTFVRDLTAGATGNDVKSLQVFLNAHGFVIAASGPGAKGMETTLFGKLTRAALAKFQAANGITPAVGYFGPKTRAFIAGMK